MTDTASHWLSFPAQLVSQGRLLPRLYNGSLSADRAPGLTTGMAVCIIEWLYNKMVMNTSQRLDATFAALADPTRRAILARLASGQASVTELAAPFAMSQPAISKHLKVLERAGLIARGQDAQRRPRRLDAKPLAQATGWLENYRRFWEGRFQGLDTLLEELKTKEKKHGRRNR
jgi:DNA-binding transcriptional ArsR family regulator